jgi:hypothetical protein
VSPLDPGWDNWFACGTILAVPAAFIVTVLALMRREQIRRHRAEARGPWPERLHDLIEDNLYERDQLAVWLSRPDVDQDTKNWLQAVIKLNDRLHELATDVPDIAEVEQLADEAERCVANHKLKGVGIGDRTHRLTQLVRTDPRRPTS